MPYTITPTEGFVHIAWHGVITVQDLIQIAPDLAQMGQRLGRVPSVLHTFDGVEEIDMEPLIAYRQSLRRNDMRLPNRTKVASVASSPTVFAYARIMEALNRNPKIEMRVFDEREPAVAWLLAGDVSTPAADVARP
ncbi:MAG TPA: STAS/SEC14 domain-containing protein [Opitutaceae bacterium]|nr:STAS/SEC14 domain-containing protein [Opitutaceae bacterium]HOR23766.1 STAS/SEC14 domain-containing protein [Opitutaceae bacterium]HPK48045.1 STAS/SEC14 domain-containing protein [Opitutaceae bacterium]